MRGGDQRRPVQGTEVRPDVDQDESGARLRGGRSDRSARRTAGRDVAGAPSGFALPAPSRGFDGVRRGPTCACVLDGRRIRRLHGDRGQLHPPNGAPFDQGRRRRREVAIRLHIGRRPQPFVRCRLSRVGAVVADTDEDQARHAVPGWVAGERAHGLSHIVRWLAAERRLVFDPVGIGGHRQIVQIGVGQARGATALVVMRGGGWPWRDHLGWRDHGGGGHGSPVHGRSVQRAGLGLSGRPSAAVVAAARNASAVGGRCSPTSRKRSRAHR